MKLHLARSRGALRLRRRDGAAARPGPHAVGLGRDRRGGRGARSRGSDGLARALPAAGGDRGGALARRDPGTRPTGTQIVVLYDALLRMADTPVVRLNRAVALSACRGARRSRWARSTTSRSRSSDYHLFHATRAELLDELGERSLAREARLRALELCQNPAERSLLERKLRQRPPKPCRARLSAAITSSASSTRLGSAPRTRITSSLVSKFGYEPTETSGNVPSSSRISG